MSARTKNILIDNGFFALFFPFFECNASYLCRMESKINTQMFYTILTKFYDSVKKLLKFWYCQLLCYWVRVRVQDQPPHNIKQTPQY